MWTQADLLALLEKLDIRFILHEHEPVFTVAQSESVRGRLEGILGKCLFLQSVEGRYWLAAVPADMRVDLKKLAQALDCRRLSFAPPEKLDEFLNLYPGAVCPYGALNDKDGRVLAVVEESLAKSEELLFFHPLENTASIGVSAGDLLKVLEYADHKPLIAGGIGKDD